LKSPVPRGTGMPRMMHSERRRYIFNYALSLSLSLSVSITGIQQDQRTWCSSLKSPVPRGMGMPRMMHSETPRIASDRE